jgi:hypothetical protein
MMKRYICTYANARLEPSREGAIFQRGGYYVVDLSGKKDPYRYGIFLRDSMLGMTGTIANAKRFCQAVYLRYPMEKDVSESMSFSDLSKKYRVKARKENKPKKVKFKKSLSRFGGKNLYSEDLYSEFQNRFVVYSDVLDKLQAIKKPKKTEYNKIKSLAEDALKDLQDNQKLFEIDDYKQMLSDFRNLRQNIEDDIKRLYPQKNSKLPTPAEVKKILRQALTCETIEETQKILKDLKSIEKPPKYIRTAIEIIESTRCR